MSKQQKNVSAVLELQSKQLSKNESVLCMRESAFCATV
jgi:hypothetical protein